MESLAIKNKACYNMATEEGRKNLEEYIQCYNDNINQDDPLSKPISYDEAFAICNVEGFIKLKSGVREAVAEALEIATNAVNFKTNTTFTFLRNRLKKLNYNVTIRMQIESYVRGRLSHAKNRFDASASSLDSSRISTMHIGDDIIYFDNLTGNILEGGEFEKIKEVEQNGN